MQKDPKKEPPAEIVSEDKEKKPSLLRETKDVWEIAREKSQAVEEKELAKERLPVEEEKAVQEQLEKEIKLMQLDEGLMAEANTETQKIEFFGEKEKLEHLLKIAKEKGLAFAINVAKNMNDPYILDSFHDLLLKQGFYQRFLTK